LQLSRTEHITAVDQMDFKFLRSRQKTISQCPLSTRPTYQRRQASWATLGDFLLEEARPAIRLRGQASCTLDVGAGASADRFRYSCFLVTLLMPQSKMPVPLPTRKVKTPNPTGVPHIIGDQRPSILTFSFQHNLSTGRPWLRSRLPPGSRRLVCVGGVPVSQRLGAYLAP
jgi:hypothetical protein